MISREFYISLLERKVKLELRKVKLAERVTCQLFTHFTVQNSNGNL